EIIMKIGIIGGGPAGLSTADHLQTAGHEVVVFEKGPIAGNMIHYPVYMTWFSTKELLELGGVPLTIPQDKPTRRDYLHYLTRFVQVKNLDVRTYHTVTGVSGEKGDFRIHTVDNQGVEAEESCELVVVAIGAFECANMMNIPGEDLPKVSHYYREPHLYHGQKVLVIGGRNSAVETALEIWRNGGEVSLSYRRSEFPNSVKYWMLPDIANRIKNGEIAGYMPSEVISIQPDSVTLLHEGKEKTIPNDFVLALTGYQPNTQFLNELGIEIDSETKRPNLDPETYESNVPGMYVVGVIQAGNISSEIFIENSRHHGEVIVEALRREASQPLEPAVKS
ncbi:MAG: YpdA family putative bacillithiol disulfide reductase, partial [Candidatus Omnitrophica bacterium]|nr:YpdA family putative bacillithiol disulfide reductase [Candidatus Omnitrophota bacterium]